ncbi:peptidylprolyl isomerase [Aquimarina sp. 2201CG5-10]|uniref:peptidylprolyl isomerase n=1 Tax=Aquimarina callyspongiae TaxID=3098150 RepID=UPI002AB58EC5|nr:peptidylprolyl isomerase [Aquimarina sp. 2201CG5-10]MDY8137768.1 peptidylprolyl isomerase [Aquimarina sp. 2201CG5-10]
MHKNSFLLFLGLIFFSFIYAQEKDLVLLTIDESPVYISEFKRVYLKNIDLVKDESQKDVDEYLDLFVNYKLKLEEAKKLGLDKKETYLKELEGYKKQLSSGYLTDSQASEALVKEAYDRSQQRIKASHILIMARPNASKEDTIAALKKINEARAKILNGGDFKTIAKEYSEDPSVAKNSGDLGWFTAFRMVYQFEDAAYKTEVGKVSEPFRTQFGYHIVKVDDKEKTLGEVSVAHIMVAEGKNRNAEEAENRIKEINKQLEQGTSFESLAKQFSDDRNTAVNGGKINRFGQGALNSVEFEKVAFGLQNKGEVSKPLKTKYGWHIIKLIEKFPPKTFAEQKNELTKLVKRDGRSQLVTKSFINGLKEKYGVVKNDEVVAYFKKIIPDEALKGQLKVAQEGGDLDKNIFTIKNQSYKYKDFANHLKRKIGSARKYTDKNMFIEEMYRDFESSTLLSYYEEHLEEDNEDFANVLSEYRDGLLLFDLMESKIWNAAKTDSIGLQKYYQSHKDQYVQNETYKVLKASSSNKEAIDNTKELLIKGKPLDEIKKEVNKNEKVSVLFSEEELIKGEDKLPKGFSAKSGGLTMTNEGDYIILMQVKEVVPSKLKTFEETRGKVINDFQENLEKQWLNGLRNKYSVKLNKKTLKKIKKDLSI